jgi:hypothetical protein
MKIEQVREVAALIFADKPEIRSQQATRIDSHQHPSVASSLKGDGI